MNLFTNEGIFASGASLIAGTAWLFSDAGAHEMIDYLFVDEAGQVALANTAAIGTSAKSNHPARRSDGSRSALSALVSDRLTL